MPAIVQEVKHIVEGFEIFHAQYHGLRYTISADGLWVGNETLATGAMSEPLPISDPGFGAVCIGHVADRPISSAFSNFLVSSRTESDAAPGRQLPVYIQYACHAK